MNTALRTVLAVLLLASVALGENVSTPVNPPYAFSRGLANMMFGWLEMPRGLVYENARIPMVGFVAGPVKGATLTTWRTLSGTMDVVCMGLTRDGLYTELVPEFVWDADWVPACGEDMAGMESIEGEPCLDKPIRKRIEKRRIIIDDPCEPCDGIPCAAEQAAEEVIEAHVVVDAPAPPAASTDGVVVEDEPTVAVPVGPAPALAAVPAVPAAFTPVADRAAPRSQARSGKRVPFGLEPDAETARRVQALEDEIALLEERVAPMRQMLSLPLDRQRAQSR
jgi:putative exosortase-associated protein (TIGR04073 family)